MPNANTILNIGVTKEMAQLLLRDSFSSRKSAFVGATVVEPSLLPSYFGQRVRVFDEHELAFD